MIRDHVREKLDHMLVRLLLEQDLMHKSLHVQALKELMSITNRSRFTSNPRRIHANNIPSSRQTHIDIAQVKPYLSKERLKVLSKVEKQMKKLSEMKERLINGGS